MREKEKLLVTSIFSFSHNVFYPAQEEFLFICYIYLSSANAFNLVQTTNLSFGNGLKAKPYSNLIHIRHLKLHTI